jgi:hypothetical protein
MDYRNAMKINWIKIEIGGYLLINFGFGLSINNWHKIQKLSTITSHNLKI